MANHSLKVFNLDQFEINYRVRWYSFKIFKPLCSSRQYGNRRFLLQQRKRRFDDKFINKAVNIFTEAAGGDDFIVVYGDGSFPLILKGMDGGDSAHKRLMMLLSKRARIVMTNEHRTTKGCPKFEDKSLSMNCPKGSSFSKNWRDNCHQYYAAINCYTRREVYYRKYVHGLS